jgi:virginiamycin A acetyltransferase
LRSLIATIKKDFRRLHARRKFPASVIHDGAVIDKLSILDRHTVIFHDVTIMSSSLGAYSYVQAATSIFNAEIGQFCSIAGDVTIGLAAHPTQMVSTSPVFYDNEQPLPRFFVTSRQFSNNLPRTFIGADVWIGKGAKIKAGVRIGVGAVIGAGSIVTKDIPPYAIAVGCPCRVVKHRFSHEILGRLIASRWWNLGDKELEHYAPFFADPVEFLNRLEKAK